MTMERGLRQVLYKFSPGSTFSHAEHNMIERVVTSYGSELDLASEQEVIEAAHAQLDNWEGGIDRLLPPTRDNYTIVEPESVYAEIFPRVFRCKDCGIIHDYTENRFREFENRGLDCAHCDGELTQIHHVMLCPECAEMRSVQVPGCQQGDGWDAILLDDSADRYQDFKWRCKECDGRVVQEGVYRGCDCGAGMIPSVHSASKTQRILSSTRVDLSGRDVAATVNVADPDEIDAIILGAYLGVFDHPETGLEDISQQVGANLERDPDEIPDEEWEAIKKHVNLGGSDEKERIIDEVERLVTNDPSTSGNLRRYVMLQEALDLDRLSGRSTSTRADGLLKEMGISDIVLTSDLPLLSTVAGYTRTYDEDDDGNPKTRARSFPMIAPGNTDEKKVPIYATRTKTEAAIIELDPRKVGHWLSVYGYDVPDTLGMDTEKARAEIHRRMEPVSPYSSIGGSEDVHEPVTRAVHRLIHTISHILLQHAAVHSGIEETSFAEYLFPEALTIAIYSNNAESYTAGGLYTLIDRNLTSWLSAALNEGEQCVYDTTCANIWDGSCHACVHTSEIGCQFFNNNLSRVALYGDRIAREAEPGFWQLFR